MARSSWRRKQEPHWIHSSCVAEWFNTLSNIPFVMIGLLRIADGTGEQVLYGLLVAAGLCSAIHHATPSRPGLDNAAAARTALVLDLIPIGASVAYCLSMYGLGLLAEVAQPFTVLLGVIAICLLVTDHVWTPFPVPWGHVLWHIFAAFAADSLYQDMDRVYLHAFVTQGNGNEAWINFMKSGAR